MWATARLIATVGCENVHLRCDATDVAYVEKSHLDFLEKNHFSSGLIRDFADFIWIYGDLFGIHGDLQKIDVDLKRFSMDL